MASTTDLGRFVCASDRRVISVQGLGIEVDEEHLLSGLTRSIAAAGVYQIFICTSTDLIRPLLTVKRVPPSASFDDIRGTVLCDAVVDFYNAEAYVQGGAKGVQGEFTLPDGPGRYRCIVTTDIALRKEIWSTVDRLFVEGIADLEERMQRFRSYDETEWYELTMQFVEAVPDDEDDDFD